MGLCTKSVQDIMFALVTVEIILLSVLYMIHKYIGLTQYRSLLHVHIMLFLQFIFKTKRILKMKVFDYMGTTGVN